MQVTERNKDHMAKNTAKARAIAGGRPTTQSDVDIGSGLASATEQAKQMGRKAVLAGMKSKYG